MLVGNIQELFALVDWAQMAVLNTALEMREPLSYRELFNPAQIEAIDQYVQAECGSPLSSFPQAVMNYGYDPTTGVPLGADPETYDLQQLFPHPQTEQLYEQYMSSEHAAELARIQRQTSLSDRTEEEWTYLEDMTRTVFAVQDNRERP